MINNIFYLLLVYVRSNHYSIVKKMHYFMLVAFPVWTAYHLYEFYNGEPITFSFVFFFLLNLYLIISNNKQLKKMRGDYE